MLVFLSIFLVCFAGADLVASPVPYVAALNDGCSYPYVWQSGSVGLFGSFQFYTQPGTYTPFQLTGDKQALLITSDTTTDWMTVKSAVDNSTLAHGPQPLYVWGVSGAIYIQWSLQENCYAGLGALYNYRQITVQSLALNCRNTNQWPATPVPIDPYKGVTQIAPNQYAGDFSVLTGAIPNHILHFTSSNKNDYITVRIASATGPVIAWGTLNQTVNALTLPTVGSNTVMTLYVSWNTQNCGTQEADRVTTVQDISGGTRAPSLAPTPWPTSANQFEQRAHTVRPTAAPTTVVPTKMPTRVPTTKGPTERPTVRPTTAKPTRRPTGAPTPKPTKSPTTPVPTKTYKPTHRPTLPTHGPTAKPSRLPTAFPTHRPTKGPTYKPTIRPSTTRPTTRQPSHRPTKSPTTLVPTTPSPTFAPLSGAPPQTPQPTTAPTPKRTPHPTRLPTQSPVTHSPTTSAPTTPTHAPTYPTRRPTSPTPLPTQMPSQLV